MAISRRDLMKELSEGINAIFDEEYSKYNFDNITPYHRIEMPRRGRYQVWEGHRKVADRIKHRREALAVMKLLMENDDGTA